MARSETTHDLTHRSPMDEIAARFQTKSDKIRALAKAGYSRAEIARHLEIRYQHVRNVLVEEERLASRAKPSLRPGMQSKEVLSDARDRLDPARSKVEPDGRVAIPQDFRRALGLKANDPVILTIEDDFIRLMSLPASIRRAQAFVRQFVPADVSLVDELLADRREAAKREDENG